VKLEIINALAQLIAAVGVIVSLFYLAVQIRQNTRSMRAMVVNSLAQSIADVIRPMAEGLRSRRGSVITLRAANRSTSFLPLPSLSAAEHDEAMFILVAFRRFAQFSDN